MATLSSGARKPDEPVYWAIILYNLRSFVKREIGQLLAKKAIMPCIVLTHLQQLAITSGARGSTAAQDLTVVSIVVSWHGSNRRHRC